MSRVIRGFGFKIEARVVCPFYMPHSGTKLYAIQMQLKLTQGNPEEAIEKANDWIRAMEVNYGWDVRFEPCVASQTVRPSDRLWVVPGLAPFLNRHRQEFVLRQI